jgi:UDP-N-acetylglucosamine--N-acetylmuramyl-(pentapeptide) pyrophosphoryl-undecaprenol N-acetylglucosamine transferase
MPTENNPEQVANLPAVTSSETLWVGGEGGIEESLVQRAGIDYQSIPAAGLHGIGLRTLPGNLAKLGRGLVASRAILRRFHPDVLLFTGGYVAAPMALAARLSGKQTRPRSLVYVPDIEPGLALKALLRLSDHAALTTENSQSYMPLGLPITISGYPLRADVQPWANASRLEARQTVAALLAIPGAFADNLPILLIIGGSKGARSINQAVLGALPALLPRSHIIHLTGKPDWETVHTAKLALPENLRQHYHPVEYLHEMGPALAAADVVLSRAGASCLGEYPLFKLPAILVPYPYAWRYQRVNAEYLVERHAAIMITDETLADQIVPEVLSLFDNPAHRSEMSQAMSALARPDAAKTIAGLLVQLSKPTNSQPADQETATWSA